MGSVVNMSECLWSKGRGGTALSVLWCDERLGVSFGMIMLAQKLREFGG
jgi:hypothetical protein